MRAIGRHLSKSLFASRLAARTLAETIVQIAAIGGLMTLFALNPGKLESDQVLKMNVASPAAPARSLASVRAHHRVCHFDQATSMPEVCRDDSALEVSSGILR